MEYLIVCLTAFLVSGLTLFSGFGLGMLLLPAFAVFFPIPVAVAATAIVHLANNIFKVGLVGRKADWSVVSRFAIPGALAAMIGAALLNVFVDIKPLAAYTFGGGQREITALKLTVGVLIIGFALLDLVPRFQSMAFERKYLPLGGLLSGFFGGLSGHQGALRGAFLIKIGLDKEAFIGTSTVSAVIVDVARLLIYGVSFYVAESIGFSYQVSGLVLAATLSAFAGAYLGARLIKKVTLNFVQVIVGTLLITVGLGMASGLL